MESQPPTSPEVPIRGRVAVVDALRGIASFAVCWYHLVWADGAFTGGGWAAALLRDSARNAWTGVEVFFVISGFVIPLALYRTRYTVRSYGSFMLKRIVRLDPPYLASMALCLVLWYLWAVVPHLHGEKFNPQVGPILLHLGYLNAFVGDKWLNPVYWTLAIEFQYYLGMGLLFAALASARWPVRAAAFVVLGALAYLVPDRNLVFHYLFVFMLGLSTFQYFVRLMPLAAYIPVLLLLSLGCDLTLGPLVAGVSLATALVIVVVRRPIPVLGFLGTVSYSLYLVHVPVGVRILGLGLAHVHGGVARVAVLLASLAVTVGVAWLFYLAVERPAQRWSSAIRYRVVGEGRRRRKDAGAPVVTGIADP